jgi:hypothetical protein
MSIASASSPLTDAQRATLRLFADALIPGGAGLPSASQADVHGKWIDRVLSVRADLTSDVLSVLDRAGEPRVEVDHWRKESPDTFDAFSLAVCGAYFMNPRVRKLLGYPGNAPRRKPAYPDEADFYLDDGALLEPVIERGPIFRVPRGAPPQ